jgi:hypothetical protein
MREKRSVRLTVALTATEAARLGRAAEGMGQSSAWLVRVVALRGLDALEAAGEEANPLQAAVSAVRGLRRPRPAGCQIRLVPPA